MKKFKEIFLYLFFGVLTTAVNIVSFYFLDLLKLHTAVSTSTAWLLSVIFAFVTNKLFVFESRNNGFMKELISFFGCRVFTGVLDLVIMLIFVDVLRYNSMLMKVLSNIIVVVLNYLFSKLFIFKNGKKQMETLYDKVVICFGDSITEGMGMARPDAYPGVLGQHLKDQIRVLNAGVGGENSYTICSRANALPFTVTNEVVFEKGEYEYASNYKIFSGINGEMMRYRYGVMGRELPITNLFIDGKPYTLRFDRVGVEEEDKYILCRENATKREVIKIGALINYDYSRIYKECYCTVLLQGANDGDMPIEIIIDRYKKIEALNDRFIAIIPHYRGDETAKLFYENFGERCVDLREYCKEDVWTDYGIEKDETDIKCLQDGKLSTRFIYKAVYGDCHLNELGYKVLADLVYKKGVELGYWK